MGKLHFEILVETLNKYKTIPSINVKDGSATKDAVVSKDILKYVKENNILVFSQTDGPILDLEQHDVELDAPFKVFSIEMLTDHISIPLPEDLVGENSVGVYIDCILCIETAPKQFKMIALTKNTRGIHMAAEIYLGPIVADFIKRLNTEAVGTEGKKIRIPMGTGKNSGVTIRKVIHVTPKKEREKYAGGTREVDWSHRWLVRGHWRKVNGIGKDRSGEYCVKEFTWVTEHDKGPDGKPLIRKTRIVD